MKKLTTVIMALLVSLAVSAQEHKKFSPEKFEAEMEQYITKEANLTHQEAAKLFPVLREMHDRQRVVYAKMRQMARNKPTDEAGCVNAIKEYDKMNIELKHLEHGYHKKMLQLIPASKLFDVIKAEYRFHRRMMKGWQKGKQQ